MILEINTPAIGQGWHRIVYVHPLDNNKAIKVVKPNGRNRQSKREIKVYKQLIKKNHTNWKHLPKFYGEVTTNKGGGIVVELIRDYDGKISKNLEFYIKRDGLAMYQKEWEEMKSYFITENILIGNDVSATNILVKKIDENQSVFVLIDSLGDHVFIPLFNNIHSVVKNKIIRRIDKAERKLRERY